MIDGRHLTPAEIDLAELGRARHALAYLTRLIGNEAMRTLLRQDLALTSAQVLGWVHASAGSWQSGSVELVIPDLSAAEFLAWYRHNTDPKSGDAAERETKLRGGHPEHFINHPRRDGIEVIENVGETELPWHVLYRSLPDCLEHIYLTVTTPPEDMTNVAEGVPALVHGLSLVCPVPRRRHLGADQPSSGDAGPRAGWP